MKRIAVFLSLCIGATCISFAQDVLTRPLVLQTPLMAKVNVRSGIAYKTSHDTTLVFDVYSPPAGSFSGDLPVVILNNGIGSLDLPKWRVYQDWGRVIAANGMIAINYQTRPNHALDDSESLIDFLTSRGREFKVDPAKMGLWTCSANVRTGMKLAFERKPSIKALAAYYGGPDSLALMRQNLPVLMVRAALDAQFLNNGVDRFIANALKQDIRLEVINYLEGIHAFDIYLDTDESREIIQRTVDFLRKNLTHPEWKKDFVLTNRNFVWLMNHGRLDVAIREFRKARDMYRADPNFQSFYNAVVREDVLNANAYSLLAAKRNDDALQLFKLMVESYPNSCNAYDGLSDAYEATGDKKSALKNAEICLALTEKDNSIDPQFRERIRQAAIQKIARLK